MLSASKPLFLSFTLCVILVLSWANDSMASQLPGDTVVVEASSKTIKLKNRGRNIGKATFWDTGKDRRFQVTPFFGPPGFQIQKVSIPIKCKCSEIDSFEVTLLYTNLASCETQMIYNKWHVLEGTKQLELIPQLAVTTDSIYLLSINLRPNHYPKSHQEDTRKPHYACFYLKQVPLTSDFDYFYSDSTGMVSFPRPSYKNDWGFTLVTKMSLHLYK